MGSTPYSRAARRALGEEEIDEPLAAAVSRPISLSI